MKDFLAIGGIIIAILLFLSGVVALVHRYESKWEAACWAQLYTLTAGGNIWRNVHYVHQWRDTLTVEAQDGHRIIVSEPYTLEQAEASR